MIEPTAVNDGSQTVAQQRGPAGMPRILLVNDNADARRLIARGLSRGGFERITEARDGREAVEALSTDFFDLIVTDVHMPHLDGWRLSRMVRSGVFQSRADVPIVVVSATFGERIAQATAREYGVNRFLALDEARNLDEVVRTLLRERGVELSKPRLLVIEDRPDTQRLVDRILNKRFEVEIRGDGPSGLDAWRLGRHDLVLLDVMLPKMSGYQVLREILRERPTQAVVMMTAFGSMERSQELMLEGAADFIAKPFEAEQLRRVCEIAVRREDYMVSNEQFAERLRALQESEEAHRKVARAHRHLLDHLATVVFELDGEGRLVFINQAWERMTGYPASEVKGRSMETLFHPDSWDDFREALDELRGTDVHRDLELRLITRDGGVVWCSVTLDAMVGADQGSGLSGQLVDVTERKKAQQKLEYLSLHDPLTGLHNRNHFDASLAHLAATAARGAGCHALLYLDIDHFKVVNDTIGHKKGDILLKELAGLVLARIRHSDIFCRLSGDEFSLLLSSTTLDEARKVAEELRATVQGYRFSYDQRDFELTASVGLAEIDGRHASPEEYFIEADKALFVAKSRGRNLVHVYDPDDRETEELSSSIDWVRRLRDAIADGRIELHLQPILHVASGRVEHFEALVRLSLEDGSPVPPGVFIPALERAGEIAALDHWVVSRAIVMLAEHPKVGRLAVNLSAHAFRDERLLPLVEEELALRGVSPERLIFEITETASLANMTLAEQMIQRLRAFGCGFALDDFGTGFSTFAYLKQLPADFLKVDGSFIRNIHKDEMDRALVRSINEVAHALGKQTVAEFVEDAECLEVLRQLGVDYAQGYGIGKPKPLAELDL